MAWCFSTRASVATVLIMHPYGSSSLRVKKWNQNRMRPSAIMHLNNIGSGNGLFPFQRHPITWTNADNWTTFSEIIIKIQIFSFKKMYVKISSAKWLPFCSGLIIINSCLLLVWGAVSVLKQNSTNQDYISDSNLTSETALYPSPHLMFSELTHL